MLRIDLAKAARLRAVPPEARLPPHPCLLGCRELVSMRKREREHRSIEVGLSTSYTTWSEPTVLSGNTDDNYRRLVERERMCARVLPLLGIVPSVMERCTSWRDTSQQSNLARGTLAASGKLAEARLASYNDRNHRRQNLESLGGRRGCRS
jgi:hypothetical protein